MARSARNYEYVCKTYQSNELLVEYDYDLKKRKYMYEGSFF